MSSSNKNSKSKTRFKDLLKKLDYNPSNFIQEYVNKNSSSNGELSMMRFLMNQRNQFRR